MPLEPADSVMLDGLSDASGPDGDTAAERVTVPEKELRLMRVIVLVPDEPGVRLSEDGFADIEKSPVDDTVRERFVE